MKRKQEKILRCYRKYIAKKLLQKCISKYIAIEMHCDGFCL